MFQKATDRRVEQFTESVSFDHRLFAHDVQASVAHAQMLAEVGLITAQECQQICQTLEAIRAEIDGGEFEFKTELEDIHMHIEQELVERLGDVGRKLHTGRSRQDLASTIARMNLRDQLLQVMQALIAARVSLLKRAEEHIETIIPAYTHGVQAQPTTFAHYLLAFESALARACERLQQTYARVNRCPLGAAALATSSFPLDRKRLAELLGFDGLVESGCPCNHRPVSFSRGWLAARRPARCTPPRSGIRGASYRLRVC